MNFYSQEFTHTLNDLHVFMYIPLSSDIWTHACNYLLYIITKVYQSNLHTDMPHVVPSSLQTVFYTLKATSKTGHPTRLILPLKSPKNPTF